MQNHQCFPGSITDYYSIHELLGKGCFGSVYLVTDRFFYSYCALKVIDKRAQSVSSEAQVMMQLNHPHITKCFEQIETKRKFYIVMEYMKGGTLGDRIVNNGYLDESDAKLYFYQMCLAVDYLHKKNVTHRDLKPDNMLLASNGRKTLLKVSDFGLSNYCSNYTYSYVDEKSYVAPEVIRHFKYGHKVDIWNLGLILYECLTGIFPFESESDMLKGKYYFYDCDWYGISYCAKSLLKSILKVDPTRRCNIIYVLKSQWLDDWKIYNTVMFLRKRYK